jgi:hypothetical protein
MLCKPLLTYCNSLLTKHVTHNIKCNAQPGALHLQSDHNIQIYYTHIYFAREIRDLVTHTCKWCNFISDHVKRLPLIRFKKCNPRHINSIINIKISRPHSA